MSWLDRLLNLDHENKPPCHCDRKSLLRNAEAAREQATAVSHEASELERLTSHIAGRFE